MTMMPADSFEWQEPALLPPAGYPVLQPTVSDPFEDPADDRYLVCDVTFDVAGALPGDAADWALYIVHGGPEADYVYVNQTRDIPSGPVLPAFTAEYNLVSFPLSDFPAVHRVQVESRNDVLPVELFPIIGAGYVHIPTLSTFDPSLGSTALGIAPTLTPQDNEPGEGLAVEDGVAGVSDPDRGAYYWGVTVAVADTDRDIPLGPLDGLADFTEGWLRHDDYSHALETVEVAYGAVDATSPPRTLEARVDLAISAAGPCPPAGSRFRIALSDDGATAIDLDPADGILFTGEVTDPTIDPKAGRHRITAAGTLGRHYRRTLASAGWGQQTETARVTRIMEQTGIPVGTIHAGTTSLGPPGQDDTAGALLDKVTGSTGGAVVEQPDGTVDYLGPDHRRGTPVELTLAAGSIVNTLTWSQHVDDLINELEVSYADAAVIMAQDPASIDTHGVYPGKIETALTSSSDAYSLGQLIVARRSEPVWQLPDLEIDLMHVLDDETRAPMLQLRYGDLIEVTDIPAPHAYTGDVKLYVEGWATSIRREAAGYPWRWRYILAVSDRTLSGVSIRWMDVDDSLRWSDVDPTITWLDVATIIDDEDLLGEPGSADDLIDGGAPGDTIDGVTLDGGQPGDTVTQTYDGGGPGG
jgi:hypothetical protein